MRTKELEISREVDTKDLVTIKLVSEQGSRIAKLEEAIAAENAEAPIQIFEGSTYEYSVDGDYYLKGPENIVRQSNLNPNSGRIVPNVYVGTIQLEICDNNDEKCGELDLEVRSIKADYGSEYRKMLKDIAEWSTELLLKYTSPASQNFIIDFKEDAKTLYQRFAFVKSILESPEFEEAIHRILLFPDTTWEKTLKNRDIRSIRRADRSLITQLVQTGNRIPLPQHHSLGGKFSSLPKSVITKSKKDTVDTPENRFIKYAISTFAKLCGDFKIASKKESRLHEEAKNLESKLEDILSNDFFFDISHPKMLPLNSPLLQRKEGYREILNAWLMLDLAAKLTWHGGEDVYRGRKRDVATLYEYWVFFKLLEIVEDVFEISRLPANKLMHVTKSKLSLNLKKGNHIPLEGVCKSFTRDLNVQLSFNKTFSGGQNYPNPGSWSKDMKPDYTLSIWPTGISLEQAELEELIIHIHFDSKYRVKNFKSLFKNDNPEENDVSNEGEETNNYKRVDLLKMHAYKDAIRRTAGAYILYPGDEDHEIRGFHEIVPGLGAFPIRPSKGDDGSQYLRSFLKDILNHFLNRTSQREEISYHTYDTYKQKPGDSLTERLPETYGFNRSLLPQRTSVLVAYYKNEKHFEWIKQNGLYNARTGSGRGAIQIGTKEAGAKFLLLHTSGEAVTNKFFKIISAPKILSSQRLRNLSYPNPSKDYYLVFEISETNIDEFKNLSWDITELQNYMGGRASAIPFSTTLSKLMKAKVN